MNTVVLLIITGSVFLAVLGAGGLIYWATHARKQARAESLARRLGTVVDAEPDPLLQLQYQQTSTFELGSIGGGMNSLIRQADVDYDLRGLQLRMAGAAFVGLVLAGVALRSWLAVGGIGVGLLPLWLLARTAKKRAERLSDQLPDALDLIARSLQAGHGLSDAMRLCAEEMKLPVAREFGRVYEEHNLGRDLRDCLNNLSERNPKNFDLKIFVSSVLLQRDTGGNLIEILENIARTIRDRFVFKAKVKALTAEARMSAYILAGLPFVLTGIIGWMRPEYLTPLFDDSIGHIMLGIAGTTFTLGVIIMRRLSTVEV